jgi:hypothetical protein
VQACLVGQAAELGSAIQIKPLGLLLLLPCWARLNAQPKGISALILGLNRKECELAKAFRVVLRAGLAAGCLNFAHVDIGSAGATDSKCQKYCGDCKAGYYRDHHSNCFRCTLFAGFSFTPRFITRYDDVWMGRLSPVKGLFFSSGVKVVDCAA